jgi:hypothetical protein
MMSTSRRSGLLLTPTPRLRTTPSPCRSRPRVFFCALCALLLGCLSACEPAGRPATIRVPADAPTVQAAIDRAASGDTIRLAPGTYREQITIGSAGLVLAGSAYLRSGADSLIQRTALDGGGADYAIRIDSVGEPVTLMGLTIRNADDGITAMRPFTLTRCLVTETTDGIDYEGGGGRVEHCRFTRNRDDGIDLDGATAAIIRHNEIVDNGDDGIEIRLHAFEGDTLRTQIADNLIARNGENGIQLIDYEVPTPRTFRIERNVIADNAMAGIGIMGDTTTTENYEGDAIAEQVVVVNNTIAGNDHGLTGGGNLVGVNNIIAGSTTLGAKNVTGGASVLAHTLFFRNGREAENTVLDEAATLRTDPQLDPRYALRSGSPAIDAGTARYVWKNRRILDLSPDAYVGAAPDLGAKEHAPAAPP